MSACSYWSLEKVDIALGLLPAEYGFDPSYNLPVSGMGSWIKTNMWFMMLCPYKNDGKQSKDVFYFWFLT